MKVALLLFFTITNSFNVFGQPTFTVNLINVTGGTEKKAPADFKSRKSSFMKTIVSSYLKVAVANAVEL